MSIFKRKKNKNKTVGIYEKAEKIVENAQEKLDDSNSAKAVAKQTLKEAQDFITANLEANKISELSLDEKKKATELLRAITKVLMEGEEIPDEAAGEFVKNLIRNDSKIVGVAVAEKASFIPDSQLKEIIDIPEVGVKEAERIVPGIDDEKTRLQVQENIDLEKLQKIYDLSKTDESDTKIIDDIYKIINSGYNGNEKINEMVKKIIARRVAYYYLKVKGAIVINRYSKIMSSLEMLESDFPELANYEYKKLISDADIADSEEVLPEFNMKTCKTMIIDELADDIANQYVSQDPMNRTLIIPNSKSIKSFSREEEQEFLQQLEVKCNNKNADLKKYQIQDVINQIHGYVKIEEIDSLKSTLESIPNASLKRKYASDFETIIDKLQDFPDEDKEKIMSLIVDMTGQVAKKAKKLNKTHNDDTEGR